MREPTVARDRERGATGVIDTLSLGYNTINRYPWMIVIPILLDFFFWMGPRLSLASLIQRVLDQAPIPAGLSDEMLQSYAALQQSTAEAARSFNLFSLLSTNFPGIPSLMAGRDGVGSAIDVSGTASAAGLALLLTLAGAWLASLYYSAVGARVTGSDLGVASLWRATWRNWLRLIGLLLLAVAAAVILGVPLLGVALLVATFASGAASMVVSFLWVAAVWIEFYLFFVVDAVVISEAGPIRAIQNSFRVVRYNLGASLGLIVLIWIVMLGMPIVWGALMDNPITMAMAILGSAYVSTGLTAASMIFYRERYAALRARG